MIRRADLLDAAAALLLREPAPELAGQAPALFEALGAPAPDPVPGAEAGDEPRLAREDWNDLFFVPASGRFLPPLESARREGRLGGAPAAGARRAYQDAGFDPAALVVSPLWRALLPPDHLGVELAFLAALERCARRDAAQAQALRETARRFHAERVAPWAGQYGRELERNARSALYRGLGRLLDALEARDGR